MFGSDEFFLWLKFVNSLTAPVKADPSSAPFRALRGIELGLLISAREVKLVQENIEDELQL